MASDDLLKILRKYDVALDSHDIASVFDDHEQGPLLAEWTKSHLTTDTLLTRDELNSYAPLILVQLFHRLLTLSRDISPLSVTGKQTTWQLRQICLLPKASPTRS